MPRAAKPGTKERLLAAGLETFHRRGYAGAGVQDIVTAAGVPKGSFYNHFDSKEGLAAAAVESYWAALRPTVVAALAGASGDAVERLQTLFRATASGILAGEPTNGCFMGQIGLELAGHSDEVRARVATAMADWTTLIAEVVEEGQRNGSIAPDGDAQTLAGAILDSYEGALMRARIERSPEPMRRFIELALPAMTAATAAGA